MPPVHGGDCKIHCLAKNVLLPQVFAPPPHRIYWMRLVGGAVFALQTLKTWAKIIVFPKASNFAIASFFCLCLNPFFSYS
jgi:hypothetical protein